MSVETLIFHKKARNRREEEPHCTFDAKILFRMLRFSGTRCFFYHLG
jgi:hypothetical protein